jgi:hypothetical protein
VRVLWGGWSTGVRFLCYCNGWVCLGSRLKKSRAFGSLLLGRLGDSHLCLKCVVVNEYALGWQQLHNCLLIRRELNKVLGNSSISYLFDTLSSITYTLTIRIALSFIIV